VADVFDALTSDRSYRKRLQDDIAVRMITENAGEQFEKKIVDAFFTLFKHGKILS